MKFFRISFSLTIGCCFFSFIIQAQEEIGAPYNPDVNADSLINLPDMLGVLPLFGQPFLPSEDDLDSENEIQSLYLSNDTLYLIPNGGYILIGNLFQAINNSSSLVRNPEYPVQRTSEDVRFSTSGGSTYVVPSDSILIIERLIPQLTADFLIDDILMWAFSQPQWDVYQSGPPGNVYVGPGQMVSSSGGGTFICHGYLIPEGEVEPLTLVINAGEEYVVPEGKRLVISWLNYPMAEGSFSRFYINGVRVSPSGGGEALDYSGLRFLKKPLVCSENSVLSVEIPGGQQTYRVTLNGYLYEESE